MSRKRKGKPLIVAPAPNPATQGHPATTAGASPSVAPAVAPVADVAPPKRKRGGQSKYTPELAQEIVDRISEGEPLAKIVRDEHMPGLVTVYDWEKAHPDFAERVARARIAGYDMIAQEALTIADESPAVSDHVQKSKLRVWTRMELLKCWDPRRYGSRVQTEVSGPGGAPVKSEVTINMNPVDAYLVLKNGGSA